MPMTDAKIMASKPNEIPSSKDIINAIENIHSKGIIHRDLKTENILVTLD